MSLLDQRIRQYADEIEEKMITWRRDFHQHPELGNQEVRTGKIVEDHLREIGVDEVYTGLAGSTGVLGIIHGDHPGPTVVLRCDMDCLPVKEESGLSFASTTMMEWGTQGQVPVMHACGHDTHTAMLMATASVLIKCKDQLNGKAALVFQPAEEGHSDTWEGYSGGEAFVNDPVFLEKVKMDVSFCLHQDPGTLPPVGSCGKVYTAPGPQSYNMFITRVEIVGKGGHGMTPWVTVDPIVIGMEIVMALQAVISRNVNPYENHATFSIGMFQGGAKFNVIPDKVVFEGALRFTDISKKDYLWGRVCDTIHGIAQAGGCTANISYNWVPSNNNSPELIEKMAPRLRETLGEDRFVLLDKCNILDDYSFFQEIAPGIMGILSTAPDKAPTDGSDVPGLHNAKMTVNEQGLKEGVKALVSFALKYTDE